MLLNLTWLIPGIPIIASLSIAVLLLSFGKTMNRLTKPVSYFLIASLIFSEIINLILFKNNISGNELLFVSNFELVVDKSSLLFSELIGLLFLFIMIFSVIKLKRRNGYVRYFIFLGLLSGLAYLFSFTGSLFHNLYDPLITYLDQTAISF
ncbi:NAD(P)H-quinone oxidoreductase NdhF [Prochlorococcus marinus]|uniref:NAD(P)H-quinone oxidoreductase NdhF n=1 Tax=Prochlorococcus marinus XMU1408 TaxID=2213228 RepID=A0A318QYI5_PROMR|nr:NAD(P)H-quinone oxidoreductase NdhF [Prochlorococcus marinus]MBW3042498.1 NAD(P)H-quinone oxidoreductase NdhF [Prochlorococcus marinus str. XMU1408]PYE01445.1 NAD(P)H-quinone oxidoreductase NdhF [Prochlorococcus marinus XMU1408]